jgi:hypothetical protein
VSGVPLHPDRQRLWRARGRHHHIDTLLVDRQAEGWELVFLHDDHPLMSWPFANRELAIAEADRRLSELIRAGWNVHW